MVPKQLDQTSSTLLRSLIILLILIAILLGYELYLESNQKNLKDSSPQQVSTATIQTNQAPIKPFPSYLTDEEHELLIPPGPGASEEEVQKHFALAEKLAQKGTTVEFTNCEPTPRVLEVAEKSEITIKNTDEKSMTLIVDDTEFVIPEKGTKTIEANFGKGPGLYGYVCKGTGLTGFFLVR